MRFIPFIFWNKCFSLPIRSYNVNIYITKVKYSLKSQHWYLIRNSTSKQYTGTGISGHSKVCKLQKMKIPEDQLNLILRPGVIKLASLFSKYEFELRIAGGAVRDLLMGLEPMDLDFATTATPTEMIAMFNSEEVRMINKNGEKHGTVTARINEENFECTTLRIDIKTDGRRAEVKFIRDWELDAGRRDLTFNALFLGLDGTIYDYFDGISHLRDKKVIFVGEPDKRLKEDYLRILRYFRFYGSIADQPDNHDEKTLSIIQNNASGLNQISGERIWMELSKIATRRFGGDLLIKMVELGLGPHFGLPADFDCESVKSLFSRLKINEIDKESIAAITILSSGFSSLRDVDFFIQRIKCSNKEKDIIYYIVGHKEKIKYLSMKNVQHLMTDLVYKEKTTKTNAVFIVYQLILYTARRDLLDTVKIENIPLFPIKGGMLTESVTKKSNISKEMKRLYEIWKQSDFTSTKDELLDQVICKH